MTTLFSSTTPLTGAAPWAVGSFTLDQGKSLSISAFGLGADDSICIEQVHNIQAGNAHITLDGCGVNLPDGEVVAKSQQLLDCGVKVCICAKQPWVRLDAGRFPPGDYRLSVSGTNIANGTVVITSEIGGALGGGSCAYCAACEPVLPVCVVSSPSNNNLALLDCNGFGNTRLVQLSGNPACASIAATLEPFEDCAGNIYGYMLKPALGAAIVGGISFSEPIYQCDPAGGADVLVGWGTL